MSGTLSVLDMPDDVRVCARCGTPIVTLAAAVRAIWADVTDDMIPAAVVERITAPVTDVWVDVLCDPSCPPGAHEPYRD
ncbi:hypothetical protein AB0M95_19365 [Sphaerisporangium sp. NPDC051017]|uniref:hypothetical protein n=1 Tax=Sphaerisporangium sp. NPDC051017 TaxID=3154636 RepID=UPI00344211AB